MTKHAISVFILRTSLENLIIYGREAFLHIFFTKHTPLSCSSACSAAGRPLQDAPFFTVKLQVKLLPCLVLFCNGVAVDRLAGFDELGAKDDFTTAKLEKRLLGSNVISAPQKQPDSDEEDDERCQNLRATGGNGSDEDSDFD